MSKVRMIFYGVMGSLVSVVIWSFIGGCHNSSGKVPAPSSAQEKELGEDRESRETLVQEGIIFPEKPMAPAIKEKPAPLPVKEKPAAPVVPIRESSSATAPVLSGRGKTSESSPAVSGTAASRSHTVGQGDTLWGISRIYGVSARAIEEANSLTDPGRLAVGQRLVIP